MCHFDKFWQLIFFFFYFFFDTKNANLKCGVFARFQFILTNLIWRKCIMGVKILETNSMDENTLNIDARHKDVPATFWHVMSMILFSQKKNQTGKTITIRNRRKIYYETNTFSETILYSFSLFMPLLSFFCLIS